MNLANLSALFWLSAIVPIVGLYILKVRLRRVAVPTMLFWSRLYDEHQPRSIWQRLRHWVSLLIQIALVSLIVAALADPFFAWEIRQLRRVVLIVDNSASMNATDVAPSRLVAAKSEAVSIIRGLRIRDELAIVSAGGLPRVVCGFSSHARTLTATVDDILPTDNPTRVAEAMELARRLLGERADELQSEIVVLTDREIGSLTRSVSEGERSTEHEKDGVVERSTSLTLRVSEPLVMIDVRRFGTKTGNVGITQFQVRRSLIDPLGYEILVEVTNASDEAVECRLDLDLNDDVIDVVPLKLTAGQRWWQAFEKTSADGGYLTAKLDRADALLADNQAWAVLPKRDPIPVTLVSENNLFLQKVFESNPLVQLDRVEPGRLGLRPDRSVTVFHRQTPPQLPAGSVLVIDPRNDCDLWTVGETVPNPLVGQQDLRTAASVSAMSLLTHVRLDNVLLPEARQVKFVDDSAARVLVRAVGGEPLLAVIEQPGQKVLLLTVNMESGDLPLRTAFPILMSNALNWFTENRGELSESLPTGAITEMDLASLSRTTPVERLTLVAPDGRRTELPSRADRISLGPFDQCGVWRVVGLSGITRSEQSPNLPAEEVTLLERACNLANREESDIRCTPLEFRTESFVAASWIGQRPIWVWLIALAWLLLGLEWWAYQRRWIA